MEKRLACHHDGSMLLEKFIEGSSSFQVRVFFDRISREMAKLCCHRYASHVMEALIKRSQHFLDSPSFNDEQVEGLASLPEMIIRLSNEIGQSFDEVIFCSWGSHVYRSMLSLLQKVSLTDELDGIFENVSLSEQKFLRDLCYNQYASPALQAILNAAYQRKSEFLSSIINGILGPFEEDSTGKFVQQASNNECSSHVLEAIVKCLDSSQFLSFYTKLIHPKFAEYLNGTPSNFLIQHIITACHSEAQIGIIIDDLKPLLGQLVEMKRAGILVRLVQWSVDHKGNAEEMVMDAVFTAFHSKSTKEKKNILERVARLQIEADQNKPYSSLGCSILSAIAGASESSAKPFVDNILDLEVDELVKLASHPQASRSIEAFVASGRLSEKATSRLVRKLTGKYASLAADKFSSHLVEKLWMASKVELKNLIMSELVSAKKRLEDSAHGRLVLRNCRVTEYERRQEQWVKEEESIERKRTYFADIIDDTKPVKKEKKKVKKTAEESLMLDDDTGNQTGNLFL